MSRLEFESLFRDIQKYLHDATYNMRYHDLLERKYVQNDFRMKLALAVLSIVATIGIKQTSHNDIWTTSSCAITLFSTMIVPLFRWTKTIGAIDFERGRWTLLRIEYLNLWKDTNATGDWEGAAKEFKKLRKKDNEFEKRGGLIPLDKGIGRQARKMTMDEFMPKNVK